MKISAHQGHGHRFLARFAEQPSPFSGDQAAQKFEPTIWEDITSEPALEGTTDLEVLLGDGVRAIQSTPLIGMNGRLLGLLNIHFPVRHRPDEYELGYIDLLARTAADFVEHWQSLHALEESEERFRTFTTATSDVVYQMSADWTEMRFLQGKEFLADTSVPSRIWLENYIPAEDREQVMAVIDEAIRTKRTFELEHRVRRADGTIGWTFSRAVPILDQ